MTPAGVRSGIVMALVLAGCALFPAPSPADTAGRPSAGDPPAESPTADAPPSSSVGEPGKPFDAETLLAAMRGSRRPGGVPDELETDAIAARLADEIWTVDGRPWSTLSAGGSCGPSTCTIELAGAHAGAEGEDVWTFTIAPATASVELTAASLRSLPAELVARLDALARELHPLPDERSLILSAATWQPPPDDGRFVLAYRSGDETGCALELTIDLSAAQVTEESASGC